MIDAGFTVALIDADRDDMPLDRIAEEAACRGPDVVMLSHSGSSSAHATVAALCMAIKRWLPGVTIVYGGVHPTYHWDEILQDSPCIDIIVRGEGEQTAVDLMWALKTRSDLSAVRGIAYRDQLDPAKAIATPAAHMIQRLDDYRQRQGPSLKALLGPTLETREYALERAAARRGVHRSMRSIGAASDARHRASQQPVHGSLCLLLDLCARQRLVEHGAQTWHGGAHLDGQGGRQADIVQIRQVALGTQQIQVGANAGDGALVQIGDQPAQHRHLRCLSRDQSVQSRNLGR